MKTFESINLDIPEVADFIEANGLSFICNEKMQVEASEEDFDKLIAQFPELDYIEAEPHNTTKAEIRTYQTNANLFVDNNVYTIFWDGLTFGTPAEYSEWIAEELTPAAAADNYDEVRQALEIATDYLRP